MNRISDVIERLKSAGLFLKPSISWGESKSKPLKTFRNLRKKKRAQGFFFFFERTGCYQHYIRQYSRKFSSLTDVLRMTEPDNIRWDDNKKRAFQGLKNALCSSPNLRAPVYSRGL